MFKYTKLETISNTELKELIKERDNRDPNEILVIENKLIESFYEVNCKNIYFKNCEFAAIHRYSFLCDSIIDNITFENCLWRNHIVTNSHFKDIKFINNIMDNNVLIYDCIFENLVYKNSLMNMNCISSNCIIKNTDFTNQEYFFLQCTTPEVTEKLYNNNLFNDFEKFLKENKDKLTILRNMINFDNCKISLNSIKNLLVYSDKIDINYFDENSKEKNGVKIIKK